MFYWWSRCSVTHFGSHSLRCCTAMTITTSFRVNRLFPRNRRSRACRHRAWMTMKCSKALRITMGWLQRLWRDTTAPRRVCRRRKACRWTYPSPHTPPVRCCSWPPRSECLCMPKSQVLFMRQPDEIWPYSNQRAPNSRLVSTECTPFLIYCTFKFQAVLNLEGHYRFPRINDRFTFQWIISFKFPNQLPMHSSNCGIWRIEHFKLWIDCSIWEWPRFETNDWSLNDLEVIADGKLNRDKDLRTVWGALSENIYEHWAFPHDLCLRLEVSLEEMFNVDNCWHSVFGHFTFKSKPPNNNVVALHHKM